MISKKELAVMHSLVEDVLQRVANKEALLILHQKESNSRLSLGCFDAFTVLLSFYPYLDYHPYIIAYPYLDYHPYIIAYPYLDYHISIIALATS
jgi:hypothetical protein